MKFFLTLITLILLSGCAQSDYDFNPTTTLLKQIITKGKNETQ